MKRYVIEREIPKVGTWSGNNLQQRRPIQPGLAPIGPDIQWLEFVFVRCDKTFCVYLAKDEAVIRPTRN